MKKFLSGNKNPRLSEESRGDCIRQKAAEAGAEAAGEVASTEAAAEEAGAEAGAEACLEQATAIMAIEAAATIFRAVCMLKNILKSDFPAV